MGTTPAERGYAYRELFKIEVTDEDLRFIRRAAHYCQPVGNDRFREQIEQKYGIQLGQMERGRPRKTMEELLKI